MKLLTSLSPSRPSTKTDFQCSPPSNSQTLLDFHFHFGLRRSTSRLCFLLCSLYATYGPNLEINFHLEKVSLNRFVYWKERMLCENVCRLSSDGSWMYVVVEAHCTCFMFLLYLVVVVCLVCWFILSGSHCVKESHVLLHCSSWQSVPCGEGRVSWMALFPLFFPAWKIAR